MEPRHEMKEGEFTCPRCDDVPRARAHCTRCNSTGVVTRANLLGKWTSPKIEATAA